MTPEGYTPPGYEPADDRQPINLDDPVQLAEAFCVGAIDQMEFTGERLARLCNLFLETAGQVDKANNDAQALVLQLEATEAERELAQKINSALRKLIMTGVVQEPIFGREAPSFAELKAGIAIVLAAAHTLVAGHHDQSLSLLLGALTTECKRDDAPVAAFDEAIARLRGHLAARTGEVPAAQGPPS